MLFSHPQAHHWPRLCAEKTLRELKQISKVLPSRLTDRARAIELHSKGWEWKHFWLENAKLWKRQQNRLIDLRGEWGPIHDEALSDWEKSEHAQTFLIAQTQGQNPYLAHLQTLKSLETQLDDMARRHFALPGRGRYKAPRQFELGEFSTQALSQSIVLSEEHDIEFYSWDKKQFPFHLVRITEALGLIKTYSPDSYALLEVFTRRLVPINQPEFVSYSLQTLPGHSFINLYHRDRLDLLDDLLHENGHHHLNHFLILYDPLREDPEPLYYSPWRRGPRPVRGIYHAHLTFFFALKLYHDLAKALLEGHLEFPWITTRAEKQKIFLRYLEEALMLDFSAKELELAFQRGQIKTHGMALLRHFEVSRTKLMRLIPDASQRLNRKQKKWLGQLGATLARRA